MAIFGAHRMRCVGRCPQVPFGDTDSHLLNSPWCDFYTRFLIILATSRLAVVLTRHLARLKGGKHSGKPTSRDTGGTRETRISPKCTLTKFDMGNGAKGIPPYPRSLRIPACLFVQNIGNHLAHAPGPGKGAANNSPPCPEAVGRSLGAADRLFLAKKPRT